MKEASRLSIMVSVNWIFPVTFFIQGASTFLGIQLWQVSWARNLSSRERIMLGLWHWGKGMEIFTKIGSSDYNKPFLGSWIRLKGRKEESFFWALAMSSKSRTH